MRLWWRAGNREAGDRARPRPPRVGGGDRTPARPPARVRAGAARGVAGVRARARRSPRGDRGRLAGAGAARRHRRRPGRAARARRRARGDEPRARAGLAPGRAREALALLAGSEPPRCAARARGRDGRLERAGARPSASARPRVGARRERLAFLETLAELPAVDPAADRRLATAGVRRPAARRRRPAAADHARRARDVQPPARPRRPAPARRPRPVPPGAEPRRTSPCIDAAADPGAIAVADAVWLDGRLLVAAGERGVLRLTADGRVAAAAGRFPPISSSSPTTAARSWSARAARPMIELQRLDLASGRAHALGGAVGALDPALLRRRDARHARPRRRGGPRHDRASRHARCGATCAARTCSTSSAPRAG